MSYSDTAISIGRAANDYQALFGHKDMVARLTVKERTGELLRICNQYGLSFKSFQYLERSLITNKEPPRFESVHGGDKPWLYE
jgi:hypothetical protein